MILNSIQVQAKKKVWVVIYRQKDDAVYSLDILLSFVRFYYARSSNRKQQQFYNKNLLLYQLIEIKDTHREKAPSNKNPAFRKSTNMGVWAVGTLNQLFTRGS